MRKILFRGKRKDNGEWMKGFYSLLFNEKNVEYEHCITYQIFEGANMDYPYPTCDTIIAEVIPETVGQFTGLTDKNGKEIFEGDIVSCKEFKNKGISVFTSEESEIFTLEDYKGECEEIYTSQVFYDEANFYVEASNGCQIPLCCFWGNMKNSQPIFEIEIVGNIHDNPELLTSN